MISRKSIRLRKLRQAYSANNKVLTALRSAGKNTEAFDDLLVKCEQLSEAIARKLADHVDDVSTYLKPGEERCTASLVRPNGNHVQCVFATGHTGPHRGVVQPLDREGLFRPKHTIDWPQLEQEKESNA